MSIRAAQNKLALHLKALFGHMFFKIDFRLGINLSWGILMLITIDEEKSLRKG